MIENRLKNQSEFQYKLKIAKYQALFILLPCRPAANFCRLVRVLVRSTKTWQLFASLLPIYHRSI